MCGRYTLIAPFVLLIERFNTPKHIDETDYQPAYNIAPGQKILAVINDGTNNRLGYLHWGLIPPWAKDKRIGYKLMNARAESLAEKPSFRSAFLQKRCLIIADSFYEWKHDTEKKKMKTPFRFQLKSGELFAMAGLWERWQSPQGEQLFSCTIITTVANERMAPIHDRMPVILRKEDESLWLNPNLHAPADLNRLLKPYDAELMEAYPVDQAVNKVKNNYPELLKRV
ncbi:MAG: SOS response-associated peptidase [Sporolactobacillus sp.]